eukprot:COSAG03_NODE_14198_length_473_cov_0.548128_1_plen_93_part_10
MDREVGALWQELPVEIPICEIFLVPQHPLRTLCWTGYLQVRDSQECGGSNSAECTSTACRDIESLWGLSVTPPTPSEDASHAGEMCEYFPGDE